MAATRTDEQIGAGKLTAWAGLANSEAGDPLIASEFGDRTVQVTGTFGTGGTLVIEGSNDRATWKTLTDPQGNALSFQAAGLETIMEVPLYTRPRVSAGDGTTNLSVSIFSRKASK